MNAVIVLLILNEQGEDLEFRFSVKCEKRTTDGKGVECGKSSAIRLKQYIDNDCLHFQILHVQMNNSEFSALPSLL